MTNFFISCLVPFFMLGFELFVHPLTPEYVSEGRGGGTRLRGNFADSVSYGLYFIGAFITMGYFFLDKIYSKKKVSAPTLKMFAVFLICAVGIAQLRHVATWGVFLVCLTWLLFYNSQNIRGLAVVGVIALIVLPIFAEPIYQHYIEPLLRKEMNVIGGDADIQYGLNGRVSRWQRYFAIWFNMGPVAQLFGVSLSGVKEASIMVGGGMHSDYVRILFLTGIVGLAAYLLFLLAVALGWRKLQKPERFLYFTAMTALAAYSVSTLPMIYLPFINYIFPITCFALLPKKRMYDVPPPLPLKQKRVISRHAFPPPAPPPLPQSGI
jgi:O-antigen ligase